MIPSVGFGVEHESRWGKSRKVKHGLETRDVIGITKGNVDKDSVPERGCLVIPSALIYKAFRCIARKSAIGCLLAALKEERHGRNLVQLSLELGPVLCNLLLGCKAATSRFLGFRGFNLVDEVLGGIPISSTDWRGRSPPTTGSSAAFVRHCSIEVKVSFKRDAPK